MDKKILLFLLFSLISTTIVFPIGLTDDFGLVKDKLNKIGFSVEQIKKIRPGEFRVTLNAFSPTSFDVSLLPQKTFRKFTLIAKIRNGMVIISRSALIAHGFQVGKKLPEGLQITGS
jgi:hypothetical protein